MYFTNDFYVKPLWSFINRTLILFSVLAAFVVSSFDDSLSSYEGGSYSAAALLFFIWGYSVSNIFVDFKNREQKPLYFSAALYPVFRYDP
jgi:hypothetical protein